MPSLLRELHHAQGLLRCGDVTLGTLALIAGHERPVRVVGPFGPDHSPFVIVKCFDGRRRLFDLGVRNARA